MWLSFSISLYYTPYILSHVQIFEQLLSISDSLALPSECCLNGVAIAKGLKRKQKSLRKHSQDPLNVEGMNSIPECTS